MARRTTSIDTTASPERVFAYLEDFTNGPSWDPGIADAERLDDGPIGVGSRFALDLDVPGGTQRWVYTVEVHEPPRRVTFVTRSGRAVGVDAVTIVPTATGCRVDWDATFRFTGVLGALVDPVFQLVFNRIFAKATAGLSVALHELGASEAA